MINPTWTLLRLLLLAALLLATTHVRALAMPPPDKDDGLSFRALSFHDVREELKASFDTSPDATAIDERMLLETFTWLRDSGHHPVSLSQIIAAREGGPALPPKAVLLFFDDGYESAYTVVWPLLKRFSYPAIMALVSSWIEPNDAHPRPAGARFLSWAQAREMAQSGLVELAAHSHDLHRGIPANPQGNLLPAATTLHYDSATGSYESTIAYQNRLRADLRHSKAQIESRTGAKIRLFVWPYGRYNDSTLAAAREAGMPYTASLQDGPNTPELPLAAIRRTLVSYDAYGQGMQWLLRARSPGQERAVNRVLRVKLDDVYDADPAKQESKLSALLDRVQALQPTSVFLQAFADPDDDGIASELYFPNRHLPMRADLFNRAAWQLMTRTGVKVYAWMPVRSFAMTGSQRQTTGLDNRSRQTIIDIYDDLGRQATFSGILFHENATRDVWHTGQHDSLIKFTGELEAVLRQSLPELLTARSLHAQPGLPPEPMIQDFLRAYDYTVLELIPHAKLTNCNLAALAKEVLALPGGGGEVIVELTARACRARPAPAPADLDGYFSTLRQTGIRNLSYYPEHFLLKADSLDMAKKHLSTRQLPGKAFWQTAHGGASAP